MDSVLTKGQESQAPTTFQDEPTPITPSFPAEPEGPSSKKKWFAVGAVLALLTIILGAAGYFYLFKSRPEQGAQTPQIELTRETIDAYGRKPVQGEDFASGVVIFGLRRGELKTRNGVSVEMSATPIESLEEQGLESLFEIFRKYQARFITRPFFGSPELSNIYRLEIPKDKEVLSIMTDLQKDPDVLFAEPDYSTWPNLAPNDPYFHSSGSWGQSHDDLWNLKIIDAPEAWDITMGTPKVRVGVLDTGIDHLNPDLAFGVSDGWGGIYLLENKKTGDCVHTHGTHVAGIIGARGNNGVGVIGVAPNITLVPFTGVPCESIPPEIPLDFSKEKETVSEETNFLGNRLASTLYAALFIKAASEGIDVLNFSSGLLFNSWTLNKAINYAISKGSTAVVAAGNESNSTLFSTPANNPNAIVVSAVDQNDQSTSYSNFGETLTVAAPGGDFSLNILSTGSTQTKLETYKAASGKTGVVGEYYVRMSGTSMAAPHVSGLAALVKSIHPDWGPKKIRCAIILGAEDKGAPGRDNQYGYGRINAAKTLSLPQESVTEDCTPFAEIISPVLNEGIDISKGQIPITGTTTAPDFDSYLLQYLAPRAGKDNWQLIKKGDRSVSVGVLGNWDISTLKEGNYQIRLTAISKDATFAVHEISVYLFEEQATAFPTEAEQPGFLKNIGSLKNTGAHCEGVPILFSGELIDQAPLEGGFYKSFTTFETGDLIEEYANLLTKTGWGVVDKTHDLGPQVPGQEWAHFCEQPPADCAVKRIRMSKGESRLYIKSLCISKTVQISPSRSCARHNYKEVTISCATGNFFTNEPKR